MLFLISFATSKARSLADRQPTVVRRYSLEVYAHYWKKKKKKYFLPLNCGAFWLYEKTKFRTYSSSILYNMQAHVKVM